MYPALRLLDSSSQDPRVKAAGCAFLEPKNVDVDEALFKITEALLNRERGG